MPTESQPTGQQPTILTMPTLTPATPSAGSADGNGDQGQQHETESLDGLKNALKAERDARKAFEKQVRELSSWKQQQEDAQKTEAQKQAEKIAAMEQERGRWEAERRTIALEREVGRLNRSERLNLVDEDAALRLLDAGDVQYGADGKPTNLLALLRDLVKERPYLAGPRRTGSADAGVGGGSATQPGDMNMLIRRAAGRV